MALPNDVEAESTTNGGCVDVEAGILSRPSRQSRPSRLEAPEPNQIVYNNLKYSVRARGLPLLRSSQVKGTKTKKMVDKVILQGLTGSIEPGRLTAVMGASGAGKTSFLNVLAGHVHGPVTLSGTITVNGEPVTPEKMREVSGFVHQEDVVLETMTVGEALSFAAALRLPSSMGSALKLQRAIDVADMLNLTKAWDSFFGSSMLKGISGGEKRRLCLGMELITNPAILFLDEPTSGLDTYNAYKVGTIMRQLAHSSGRTVVATIHQPSSEIFQQFDDLIVLAEGAVLYHGKASELVGYLSGLGYECPNYTNPADFLFMDVLHAEQKQEADSSKGSQLQVAPFEVPSGGRSSAQLADAAAQRQIREQERIKGLIDAWAASPEAAKQLATMSSQARVGGIHASAIQAMASAWVQLQWLAKRAGRNAWRNKLIVKGKLAQTIFLSLVIGLIYLQIGNDQTGVQDRTGSLFFITVNSMFGSVMSTLTSFSTEKPVFLREYSARMYALPPYFWSRYFIQLPPLVMGPIVMSAIVYWMVGYQAAADKFFWFMITLVLLDNCGAAIGIFVSCLFNEISIALAVVPMVILPLMVFSGFFVNSNSIPPYFTWIQYLSPMRYGFIALAKNEFAGLKIECTAGQSCPPGYSGEDVLQQLGFNNKGSIEQNVGILFALTVGFLLMAYVALWAAVRRLTK